MMNKVADYLMWLAFGLIVIGLIFAIAKYLVGL